MSIEHIPSNTTLTYNNDKVRAQTNKVNDEIKMTINEIPRMKHGDGSRVALIFTSLPLLMMPLCGSIVYDVVRVLGIRLTHRVSFNS